MNQPLSIKTVIVPSGQNKYGRDVIRFTADYLASDLFDMCIGCYPPCQNDLTRPDSSLSGGPPFVINMTDASSFVDLRKATEGICDGRKPTIKTDSLLDKLGTSVVEPSGAHYWDV